MLGTPFHQMLVLCSRAREGRMLTVDSDAGELVATRFAQPCRNVRQGSTLCAAFRTTSFAPYGRTLAALGRPCRWRADTRTSVALFCSHAFGAESCRWYRDLLQTRPIRCSPFDLPPRTFLSLTGWRSGRCTDGAHARGFNADGHPTPPAADEIPLACCSGPWRSP